MNKKALAAVVAGLALVGVGIAGPSQADPTSKPRAINGMGSDTTQDVMNGFSKLDDARAAELASWDATPKGSTVDTGVTGCSAYTRADGSSAGRTALLTGTECLQFARSSSFSANAGLTYYPFAVDGLTYAITQNSSVPKNLTKAQLQSIFKCGVPSIQPVQVQAGSGTRKDWFNYLYGSAVSDLSNLSAEEKACYPAEADLPQEHDGRALKNNQIMPYSVAKWISQLTGVTSDVRGRTRLPLLDSKSPISLNIDGANTRTVYNVLRRADADAIAGSGELTATQTKLKGLFVGSDSLICANPTTIVQYGFAPVPSTASIKCGEPKTS